MAGAEAFHHIEHAMDEQEFLESHGARAAGFGLETFRPLRGETFVYRDAAGAPHELLLSDVEEGKQGGGFFDSFTLVFTGPRDVCLAQGHYLLEHGTQGEFPLLLVPTVSLDPERNACCAYFSIRKNPAR